MDYYQSCIFRSLKRVGLCIALLPALSAWAVDSVRWAGEVAVAFPQPLSVGAQFSCSGPEKICLEGLTYYTNTGFFRWPLAGGERALNEFSVEIGARYLPFKFPLVFAGGIGFRKIAFSAGMSSFTIDGASLATSATLNLSTLYFCPTVGWSFNLSKNLLLGLELGVQLPLLASGSLFLEDKDTGANSDNSEVLSNNSATSLKRIAALPIPKLTLVRLTWFLE